MVSEKNVYFWDIQVLSGRHKFINKRTFERDNPRKFQIILFKKRVRFVYIKFAKKKSRHLKGLSPSSGT